jgi:hypothetical protein
MRGKCNCADTLKAVEVRSRLQACTWAERQAPPFTKYAPTNALDCW